MWIYCDCGLQRGQLQQQWKCPQSVKQAWISTFLRKNVFSIKEKSPCRTVKYKASCLIGGDCLCTTVELQVQIWCVHSQVGRLILKISLCEILAAESRHKQHSASSTALQSATISVMHSPGSFTTTPSCLHFTQHLWSRILPHPPCFLVEFMQFVRDEIRFRKVGPVTMDHWLGLVFSNGFPVVCSLSLANIVCCTPADVTKIQRCKPQPGGEH